MVQAIPKEALLLYNDSFGYDETPLYATVQQGSLPHGAEAPKVLPAPVAILKSLHDKTQKVAEVAKLLQINSSYSMLVKMDSKFVMMLGQTFCPLQVLQQNTAAVLKTSLSRMGAATAKAQEFKVRMRSVCTDAGSGNIKAEQDMTEQRGDSWSLFHVYCDVHKISRARRRTFEELQGQHVSGLIRVALSLRQGAMLNQFRGAMASIIRSKIIIKHGCLSGEAWDYKKAMLNLFLKGASNAMYKQILLLCIVNGDWRKTDVEYLVPLGQPLPPREEIAELMVQTLVTVLCGSRPHIWPRHRWIGSQEACCDIGLLCCVHGLLLPSYKLLLQRLSHTQAQTPKVDPHVHATVLLPLVADDATHLDPADEHVAPRDPHEARAVETEDWAQKNAKERALAWQWISKDAFPDVCLLKLVLDPLTELLGGQLQLSGESWDIHQQALLAQSMLQGDIPLFKRSLRLLEAGNGTLENKFFQHIQGLYTNKNTWQFFPNKVCKNNLKVNAFKLLSRAAGSVFYLFALPHQHFPFVLFKLLHDPHLGQELAESPDCLKDSWSLSMQKQFPGFIGEDFLQVLACIAHSQTTDISTIESRHASIRRSITSKSLMTWTYGVTSASADWLCQNFRRSQARWLRMTRSRRRPTSQWRLNQVRG